MGSSLPPLRPRLKRRLSESSIDVNLPRTFTLSANKTDGRRNLILLSNTESISPESARINSAPFVPVSYLHSYDCRFAPIQTGTSAQNEVGRCGQVQKKQHKENNFQIELAIDKFQEHSIQQQASSLQDAAFFGTSVNLIKNENQNALIKSVKKRARRLADSDLNDHYIETGIKLDSFQFRRRPFSVSLRSNQAMKTRKSKTRESLMVRNYAVKPTFQSWPTSDPQQIRSAACHSDLKYFFRTESTVDPELSTLSQRFEQVVRISF